MNELPLRGSDLILGGYAVLLIVAAVWDARRFVIPDAVSAALVALFAASALALPGEPDWLAHAGAAAAAFLGAALLYRFDVLGGGDVKLVTAVALWAGLELLPELLVWVSLSGGALALVLVAVRRLVAIRVDPASDALPRALRVGEAVPYGVAIAAGGIILGPALPLVVGP